MEMLFKLIFKQELPCLAACGLPSSLGAPSEPLIAIGMNGVMPQGEHPSCVPFPAV